MAPRGEILDSDEEDNDFSPAQSPGAARQSDAAGADGLESPRKHRAESTDPSFFRDVYDDQHVSAVNAQQSSSRVAALSNDPVSTSSNPPPNLSHLDNQNEHSHLSSITDPVPASRRKEKKTAMKDAVDLTQITSPGRPTPSLPADIWDFPASQDDAPAPAPTSSAKKKIILKLKKPEKRKSTLSSSITSPEQQMSSGMLPPLAVTPAEQPTSKPRQKKRRISSSGEPHADDEEIDLLVIPRSEDKVAPTSNFITPTNGGNSSSIVEDSTKVRATQILVVPATTLTASQKEEFKFVSLDSETDNTREQAGLATPGVPFDDLQKSSGNATIKYPTPSEFASSGRGALSPGDYGTASSCRPRRRRNMAVAESPVRYRGHSDVFSLLTLLQPSSPDIISAPVVTPRDNAAPAVRDMDVVDRYLPPSSPPPRSARRRGKEKPAAEEIPSPNSAPAVVEDEPPRTSGRIRIKAREPQVFDLTASSPPEAGNGDTTATPTGSSEQVKKVKPQTIQEKLLEKKRGRKRKEVPSEVVVEEILPDTAPQHGGAEPAQVEEAVEIPAETPAEPAPKKRRGRPKKSEAAVTEDVPLLLSVEEVSLARETPKPTQKKRGRPKKSAATQPKESSVPVEDGHGMVKVDEQGHVDHDDEPKVTKGKAGKNARTTTNEASHDDETPAPLSERDSNSNRTASPTKPATTTPEAVDKEAKENKLAEVKPKKEEAKPATQSSQPGKVPYRVGLSKRSRIAPLLKSFRK
ncbi:hypothetical protein GE09DRAFT_1073711 [Coniochaeta sp. 2T2.1]|nr:hypothetical protein GE09DRAFT_1073711 [Coniochaeta sp. 2T2.1]